MLGNYGFVDPLQLHHFVGAGGADPGSFTYNPYAAMPSMHVGWSLLVGVFGFRASRSRWLKAFFAVHPLIMVLTVTATRNHYFVDSIGGAAAALAAIILVAAVRRVRLKRSSITISIRAVAAEAG